MNYFENPKVESRYPKVMRFLLEGIVGWNPGTVLHMKMDCDPGDLKSDFIKETGTAKKQLVLQNFLDRCPVVYSKNNSLSALKAISQRGSFHNHPFFKYSYLNFPANLKTRALWGIKNQSKRDLVIVRPGIFASVDELVAERYLMFLLTELNDFHVVVLENSTSGDQIVNNSQGIIAGPKEAFENLYLIDQIRKHPKLGPMVGKIHLLGISLGANGVLLSSLVNKKENYRYFDKTLLMCPVVDLPGSFAEQMKSGLVPFAMDWWSSRRFKDLASKKDFELPSAWNSFFELSPRWVKTAWSLFEKKYQFQPEWQSYLSKDFYTGDFKKDYQFYTETTVLPNNFYVLATKVDPIVFPSMNFEKLRSHAHDNTFFHIFEDGMHCSLAYTYQWKFLDQFISGILDSGESGSKLPKEKFRLDVVKAVSDGPMDSGSKPEIRSVEISKLEVGTVELLVYFLGHSHLKSAHVRIPLKIFSLDTEYTRFDSYEVRNYIKRFVQTKGEIVSEQERFFIKI